MEKTKRIQTVTLGGLISALYDETSTITSFKELKTLLVALALRDLSKRVVAFEKGKFKPKNGAAA